MVLRVISDREAFHNVKSSPVADWPTRQSEPNRLEPICKPGFTPGFAMNFGDKVFTVGSCFARHVEQALASRGFDIVTRKILEADVAFAQFGVGILNNYGVPSIFNELDWALNGDGAFKEEDNFFEMAPGQFVDIHLTHALRPAPIEVIRRRRAAITGVVGKVVECPTVIMTLGLAEVWFDCQTGRYLNLAPAKVLTDRFPGRFALHVLDYDTSLSFLRKIITLLGAKAQTKQKVLVTVSPVPLITTFTLADVMVANCYSKSLLRTIAEVVAAENDHVDYYPSYESVTLSDRSVTWCEDLHHVEPPLIHLNVERMIEAYAEGAPSAMTDADITLAVAEATDFLEAKNPAAAVGRLEPLAGRLVRVEDIVLYAKLLTRLGRLDDAIAALERLPPGAGGWQREIGEAEVLLNLGRHEEAMERASALTRGQPRRPQPWRLLAQAHLVREELDEAIIATKRWADVSSKSSEPLRFLAEVYTRQEKFEAADTVYRSAIAREVHKPAAQLDYADFLIARGRFDDARTTLDGVVATNHAIQIRLNSLRLFAP